MGRFVVIPKPAAMRGVLRTSGRRLLQTHRKKQLEEAVERCSSEPLQLELTKELKRRKIDRVGDGGTATAVTGISVLEAEPEQIAELRRVRPEFSYLADRALDLIDPERLTETHKTTVARSDLWHLAAVGVPSARKQGVDGHGVTVAVLDTGVDGTHPELTGRVVTSVTYDVDAWTLTELAEHRDTDGHGTHVAALIAGKSIGVAPGARIYNGIMTPKRRGTFEQFCLAMSKAAEDTRIQIVNISAGLHGYRSGFEPVLAMLLDAGMLTIAAVGNEGRNRTRSPGNYRDVLTVGATTLDGRVASFSGSGQMVVDNQTYSVPDIVAPGAKIYSAVTGGGFQAWTGTSMATPVVSGLAACILQAHPGIDVVDLQEMVLESVSELHAPAGRAGVGLAQFWDP